MMITSVFWEHSEPMPNSFRTAKFCLKLYNMFENYDSIKIIEHKKFMRVKIQGILSVSHTHIYPQVKVLHIKRRDQFV